VVCVRGPSPEAARFRFRVRSSGARQYRLRAIARPRLGQVLAEPDWRVALVTGGPGTGKTVSVAQWFATLDPVAREWVTLDAHDDRPERFWLTFVLALGRGPGCLHPGRGGN
jgi:ATP/maltotriose-dependent transcriptional regulator MalT